MKTIIVKNNLENMITTNEQSPLITPMPSLYGPPNVTRTNAKLPPFTVIPIFLKWTSFIVIFLAVTETMIKMSSFLKMAN